MSGAVLALLALATTGICLAGWMRAMQAVELEGKRPLFIGGFALGLGLAIAALAQGVGILLGIPTVFALLASIMFLGLAAISSQERKQPAVSVGGAMLPFSAPADDGTLFDSTALQGRPYLLKFFRGHW